MYYLFNFLFVAVRFQPLYSEDKEEEDDEDPINFDQDDK